jgi:hypothetical protein
VDGWSVDRGTMAICHRGTVAICHRGTKVPAHDETWIAALKCRRTKRFGP